MGNIVIDTSVWIDFFNKKNSPKIEIVKSLIITETVVSNITLLPVIIQEILQGIQNNKHYDVVKESLAGFNHLVYDNYDFAVSAADLYRYLQKKGVTVRKANDCLIASLCIEYDFPILHNDRDFDSIAKHTSLKIYT